MAAWLLAMSLSGIIAYLLCSIPFTLLYGRLLGVDIRKEGSGNVGGTNLVRLTGAKGLPGLLLDVSKGMIVVLIARYLVFPAFGLVASIIGMYLVLLAAVLGHMFSVFLGFKGGKSIAVSGGGLIAIEPAIGLLIIAIWFVLSALTDLVSVGSVASATLFPIYTWFFFGHNLIATVISLVIGALVIWAHRGNLTRVANGTEKRLGLVAKLGMAFIRGLLKRNGAEVTGLENIPPEGGFVLVSNHLKNSDPFMLGSFTGRLVVFLAKKELWQNPFIGYVMWLTEAIKIDRDNPSRETLSRAISRLKDEHRVIGVFPEGHRNKEPQKGLLPLNNGASFIAAQSKANVLPATISYPYKGKQSWVPKVHYGELIVNPDNLDAEAKRELLAQYGVKKSREALQLMIEEQLTTG